MIRRAIIIYLSSFLLAQVLSGCCNCPPAPTHRYRWTNLVVTQEGYRLADNKVYTDDDSSRDFSQRNLVLQVTPVMELLAARTSQRDLHLQNRAYACKCIELYQTDEPISKLRVISLTDYDSSHPAMSDITEYFRTPIYGRNGNASELGPLVLGLPDTTAAQHSVSQYFLIYLAQKPSAGSMQQFKVELVLQDSSKLEATTRELRF